MIELTSIGRKVSIYKYMGIKEIAKHAKASVTTVSYVLNGTGNIGEQTKEKVLRIARENGYIPNQMAKGLRKSKSGIIGVIAEDITSFQTPRIINGINTFMEERGYHILLSDLDMLHKVKSDYTEIRNHKEEIEAALNLFESAQVEGVIYVALHDRDVSNLLTYSGHPLVYTYCYDESKEYPFVTYENERIAERALQYLIDHGHRKIGVIWGRTDSKPAQKRFWGVEKCLEKNGLNLKKEHVFDGDWEYASGVDAFHRFQKMSDRPTAIFAMNDLMAVGFMNEARVAGIRIPDDLSIIGFDNREVSGYSLPKLTTVNLPLETMGIESSKRLLSLILGEELEDNECLLPCELVIRDSVGKMKGAAAG